MGHDPGLYSARPGERLDAARSLGRRDRKGLAQLASQWPPYSPGSVNAWLVMVTTKPPNWHDPLLQWVESPPVAGEPHPNFFYPDPLGFWAEVRRWATELVRTSEPDWSPSDALAVTALLHRGGDDDRLTALLERTRPRVLLFLDEPAWVASGLVTARPIAHSIVDPHRPGKTYEGFWGETDGVIVGKAPQHPATHNLYRSEDMLEFLRAAPTPADH